MSATTTYARIAGVGYVAIFALALHANFSVLQAAPFSEGPEAVLAFAESNIAALRLAALELLIVMAADVVVALALYRVFRAEAPFLNGLSALFRLVYTTANISAILHLASVMRWIEVDDPALAAAMTNEALRGYGHGFTLTLGFFGIHLLLLGWLMMSTRVLPFVIGALVLLAGCGYVFDATGLLAFPDFRRGLGDAGAMIVILPALIGEGLLMLWLLFGPVGKRG
ncbi:MAG: DUF4386 domain-containing protein [Pseudomonadota bacterium]